LYRQGRDWIIATVLFASLHIFRWMPSSMFCTNDDTHHLSTAPLIYSLPIQN